MSAWRRRLTTSTRVALAVMTVLVVGVVALSLLAYFGVSGRLAADTDNSLAREADAYAAAIASAGHARTGADLETASRDYLVARTGAEIDSRPILLVRFPSGKVISNSGVALETAPGNAALLAPATASHRFVTLAFEGKSYRTAVVPVTDPAGGVVAVFEAALSTAPERQIASQLAWTLLAGGVAVVLLGAVLSAVLARGSLRPLREAAATTAEVTSSSLERRVAYDGPDDEVGCMVRALNEMLDRLEQAFGEQRRFVADASHELRTPLAVIRGNTELLSRGDLSGADRAEAFAIVFAEVDRMNRLVDDLLALARLDAAAGRTPRQHVELATLAFEATARARAFSPREFAADAPEPVWVEADPDALMQALLNLLRNAAAHSGESGPVTVSARRDGDAAVLEVADTGPGIPEGDLGRIFDRFYRAQGRRAAETGGSGLGLAITKRLVELHGGKISARNAEGGGAVFRIELPAIAPPADASTSLSDENDGR